MVLTETDPEEIDMAEKLFTTRRAVLAGLAAAPVAALPVLASASPDPLAPLRTALANYRAAEIEFRGHDMKLTNGRLTFDLERRQAVRDAGDEIIRLVAELVEHSA